jgi:four helix bundle protein
VDPKTQELRERVKQFAVRVVKFVRTIPDVNTTRDMARQLLRSATGISANYHSTGRSRSRAEFVAKLGIVLEEADEAEHWLDLIFKTKTMQGKELESLCEESRQLRAIFAKSVKTARENYRGASNS